MIQRTKPLKNREQMAENTFINRGGAKAKMEALMMVLAVQSCNVFLIFYK